MNEKSITAFLIHIEKTGKSEGTIKQYKSDLSIFYLWLEKQKKTFDEKMIARYVTYLKRKGNRATTIRRHLSVLRQLMKFLEIPYTKENMEVVTQKESPLELTDFITTEQTETLLTSMRKPRDKAARDTLIPRNLAIILFMTSFGLRPKEIAAITMRTFNLARGTVRVKQATGSITFTLSEDHLELIREYLQGIDKQVRPRIHADDPLFVAFNNRNLTYLFDYKANLPKALTVRSIQEVIKTEARISGVRHISAKHLRNRTLLTELHQEKETKELQEAFGLTHPHSLRRYRTFLEENPNAAKEILHKK